MNGLSVHTTTQRPGVAAVQPGALLSERYQIIERLGKGGMGVVYLVLDTSRDLRCALKVLDPRLCGPSDITRFTREFRAASRLSHPHCVRVFDLSSDGAQRYYTMEYVPGGSLDQHPPARISDAVLIALQTLAALDLIHAKQIVHRDIKPPNILLDHRDGAGPPLAKLADFGIAKVADTEAGAEVGRLLGSLPYLAPEQAEEGRADPRSDLYSFGVVLYQLLTGRLPFQPEKGTGQKGWLALHRAACPTPVCAVAPEVPEALGAITMRLLSKDPERRYPTAAAVYDDLRRWLEVHHPGLEPPPHPPLLRAAYLAAPRFVGRVGETAAIRDFLDKSRTPGGPVLLTLAGEAGLGKSRLGAQLARTAQGEGTLVITGTCRAEPGGPYEPLAPLLRLLGVSTKDTQEGQDGTLFDTLRTTVQTTLRGGLSYLQQGLQRPRPAVDVDDREGQQWSFHRRIADGLIGLAREQPVLLLLEDVHWADAPTLLLLGFLLRAVLRERQGGEALGAAFVLSHRPAPDHATLHALLEQADAQGARRGVDLRPLELAEAGDLVASTLVTERDDQLLRFTGRILHHAEGNPLYLLQILHVLLASGQMRLADPSGPGGLAGHRWDLDAAVLDGARLPSTMRDAIGDRAARLSIDTKRTLAAAAVVGRSFELSALQAVTQIEEALLLDCLDEAIRAGFIEEHDGGYRLQHDRFRDAIYDRLPREEAVALHRAVAAYLEGKRGDGPEVAADLAHHYEACGEDRLAHAACLRAAAHAMLTYAFARAADFYEKALELGRRTGTEVPPEIIDRCGDAFLQAGRYDLAARSFAERLSTLTDPLERAEVLRKAADVEFRRGQIVRAQALLEDVVDSLGYPVPRSRSDLALRLTTNTTEFLLYVLLPGLLVRTTQAQGTERLKVVVRACNRLTEAFYATDYYRASFYMMASVNLSERVGPSAELSIALSQQGYILSTFGLHKLGARYLERGRTCSEAAAGPVERAWNALLRGLAYACEGDAAAHNEQCRKAEALLRESRDPMRLRSVWMVQAEALLEMGRVGAAREVGAQLLQLAEELGDQRGQGWALYGLGRAALRGGDHEAGRRMLREAAVACERLDRTYGLAAQSHLALDLLLRGPLDEALQLSWETAREVARLNLRHFSCVADGALLCAAALTLRRDGRVDRALQQAVEGTLRWRRQFARSLRYVTPLFLAGEAAWHVACGALAQGRRGFAEAIAWAERYQLIGAQHDVHAVAAAAYPAGHPDRPRHEALAAALEARLRAG